MAPGRTYQRAGDDQSQVLDGEADAACRPAGIAVQHGDDHRHVRPADRDDQQKAQSDSQPRNQPEHRRRAAMSHEDHDQRQDDQPQDQVQLVLELEQDGRALHQRLELGEGDQRAAEGDGADGQAHRHLDQALRVDVMRHADAEGAGGGQRAGGHEHGGQAHQRVEGGDQLRQRRHRDAAGHVGTDAAAQRDAGEDPNVTLCQHAVTAQGGGDGDGHADHAVLVAASRGDGAGQAAQCQDEQDRRDQIEQRGQVGGHVAPTSSSWSWTGTSRACAG